MLRNVLVDYLNQINEREFDLPFLALLSAAGFFDIHFTHGQVEFGKDFIAKRIDDEVIVQYSFQSKAGNITLHEWRSNILGQMTESILTRLSHPSFSKEIPHQAILVCTGKLVGHVSLALQELNEKIQGVYQERPIIPWDQESLLSLFETYGLEGVYNSTAQSFIDYGNFYTLYGKCLKGIVSDREIEVHSQQWIDTNIDCNMRLLISTVESEIITQLCKQKGYIYEAIFVQLGLIRSIAFQVEDEGQNDRQLWLIESLQQAKNRVTNLCFDYFEQVKALWEKNDKNLNRIINGMGKMITYLIQCSRILEISGYLYFIQDDISLKEYIIRFLLEFITNEPGCTHIPSDRYAVSIILPIIALFDSKNNKEAIIMVKNCAIWVCDRYQDSFGLASIESTELEEIETLFGVPFSFIELPQNKESLLATILCDLAAFLNGSLYSDIVNDTKACEINMQYWQPQDTLGLFKYDSDDVIAYPNIDYSDTINNFNEFNYADHIISEPKTFSIVQKVNVFPLISIMLLLRDRYFPTIWPLLISEVTKPS
jgi:hypothetical protein